MTVWTLTPNPALDFTYRVPTLAVGVPHRIEHSEVRPGGKGVNVARVLAQLGVRTTATGFLGGANGDRFADLLAQIDTAELIQNRFQPTSAQTRMSIAVVEDNSEATVFNEAGVAPSDDEWEGLLDILRGGLKPGDILASCGSFPGASSPAWITRIVEVAHEAGARMLVDATGPILEAACSAGADLVKPNDLELKDTTGKGTVLEGAHELLERGVGIVITSEGAKGMSVHGPDGSFRAKPARLIEGNPTGAGDASVAAWCAFLSGALSGSDAVEATPLSANALKDGLPHAVALSGAAVAMPVAGEVDLGLYYQMTKEIKVEDM